MTDKSTADMLKALGTPFPKNALKQRAGGGGKPFTYVETHTVIHRLNSATNGEWNFHVRETQWRGDLLIVLGELTIPGLGTRSGFGVQKVSDRGGEDLVKGAVSDALKKCATLFGTGLELYGSDYEAEAVESPVERPNAPQKATQPPATPTPINANGNGKAASEAAFKRIYAILADHGLEHRHLHAYAVAAGHESSKELSTDELKKLADGLKEKTSVAVTYLKKLADDLELKQVTADLNVNVKSNAKGQK